MISCRQVYSNSAWSGKRKKSYYLLAAREWAPAVNHFKIVVRDIPLSVFLQQENVN